VAWYDDRHLARLERIRTLQQRGFTLATIVRLVTGDLDAADEALLGELTGTGGSHDGPAVGNPRSRDGQGMGTEGASSAGVSDSPDAGEETFTLAELAVETGVPLALLKSIEAEGLLVPRRIGNHERYTTQDVATSKAGLLLLEWGIPLSALLELARRHHEATERVAREAVDLFSTYVRGPLHRGRVERAGDGEGLAEPGDIGRLVQAYSELLPAVNTLVANHFTRTLVNAALDHVDRVGSAAERRAVWDQIGAAPADAVSRTPADDPTRSDRPVGVPGS
jgi:DNA-binding transcriptional MerR regulator